LKFGGVPRPMKWNSTSGRHFTQKSARRIVPKASSTRDQHVGMDKERGATILEGVVSASWRVVMVAVPDARFEQKPE
jgi:hypothetical protein